MQLVGTRLAHLPVYEGLTTNTANGPVWDGQVRPTPVEKLLDPLRWSKPRLIFLNSLSDLWMQDMEDEWIDRTFALIAMGHWHHFQMLTKRPDRQKAYLESPGVCARVDRAARRLVAAQPWAAKYLDAKSTWYPYGNLIIGTSVEDRLGPIDLRGIDQVIVGGESKQGGRRPRPLPIDAVREVRDQCQAAGVAFHFKQVGSNHEGWPGNITGKGDKPDEWPDEFKLRQDIDLPMHVAPPNTETHSGSRSTTPPP
jgi:protein gp37